MSFKVAFIGAGSLVFARTLFTDLMSVPEFSDIESANRYLEAVWLLLHRVEWTSVRICGLVSEAPGRD